MRRFVALALLVVGFGTFALLPGSAVSGQAGPPGPAPYGDAVTGTGTAQLRVTTPQWSGDVTSTFGIDAHSGPSGEDPSGTVSFPELGIVDAPITCLEVRPVTFFGGTFLQATMNFPAYGQTTMQISDDTPSQDQPDDVVVSAIGSTRAAADCSPLAFSDANVTGRVTTGDVAFVDVPPLPTRKAQCKHGGWRDFGSSFRSQGHCIAYVQRHP